MYFDFGLAFGMLGAYLCAELGIGDWTGVFAFGWSWDDMCFFRLRVLDRGANIAGYVYLFEIGVLGLSLHLGYLEPGAGCDCEACDKSCGGGS